MNVTSSVEPRVPASSARYVVVADDAVFLLEKSWLDVSTLMAGHLTTATRVVSSTGNAKIMTVNATNYTGGVRNIFAEPFSGNEDDEAGMPSLFSKLPHTLSLLVATKNRGSWVATPRNVKKIIIGDLIVATPPVTPAIREISVKVWFPDGEIRSVVIARVTMMRDGDFARRPMRALSFSGGGGIVCDGFMIFPG